MFVPKIRRTGERANGGVTRRGGDGTDRVREGTGQDSSSRATAAAYVRPERTFVPSFSVTT